MTEFDLLKFVPFRFNRLTGAMSEELAKEYMERFGISIIQWRIIANLAAHRRCTAQSIVRATRTHKSRVSRSVQHLVEMGLVKRMDEGLREVQLALTAKGAALHKKLVPIVLDKEEQLLSCLSAKERKDLLHALDTLERSLGLVQTMGSE